MRKFSPLTHNTVRLLGAVIHTIIVLMCVHIVYYGAFDILCPQAPKPIQQTDNAPPPPLPLEVPSASKMRVRGKFDFKSVSDYYVCVRACASVRVHFEHLATAVPGMI